MELGSPVVVVSAFGRCHWLAAALAKEGIKTTLIDVSAHLGVWPSEDVEGPFGFFKGEGLSALQTERLHSGAPFVEVPTGFTIWKKKGPLEFKSSLTKFQVEQENHAPKIQQLLLGNLDYRGKLEVIQNAASYSFDESWLLHFAHQWAGTTYQPSAKGCQVGSTLPLFSSFYVRHATRSGLEKSLEWLKAQGVEVLQPQQIVDASFGGSRVVTGFELAGDRQGLFHAEQVVLTLGSEECYFINERLGKYFFPEGPLEPEWCWVRYRLGLQKSLERDRLPLHAVLIEDINSPWAHENMVVLQRTMLDDQFDAWMRIPNVQRFNQEYLKERSLRLRKLLIDRMATVDPQVLSFPQEYYYTHDQLGPARFPVFGVKQAGRRGKNKFKNLYFDNPEIWPNYSIGAYFDRSEQTRDKILAWWKEKLLKEQKEKRKGSEL